MPDLNTIDTSSNRARTIGRPESMYPSPFFDMARTFMPSTTRETFEWCAYFQQKNPLINAVTYKLAAYAITDLVYDAKNPVADTYKNLYEDVLQMRTFIQEFNLDRYTFGNAFASVAFPISKILECVACGFKKLARDAAWKWKGNKFVLECSSCKHVASAKVKDETLQSASRIKLVRWNPRNITLKYNELTQETRYFYSMPLQTKNELRLGRRETLCETPQAFLDALDGNKLIELRPGTVFHARRAAISRDPSDSMWGAPIVLPVLQTVFLMQVLQKSQEVVAMEYVVPFRFLHPDVRTQGGDVYGNVSLVDWQKAIKEQVQQWKRDAGHIAVFPVPVGQQVMGGQGRSLLLHQELRIYGDMILGGMGVPPGFYYGEAQWNGANVNLRALENEFLSNRQDMQRLVDFITRRVSSGLAIEYCKHKFKPFKMADDLARAQFKFGLAREGYISRSSFLQDIDYDYEEENRLIEQEQATLAKRQQEQALAQAATQGLAGIAGANYQMVAQSQAAKQQQAAAQPAPGQAGPPQDQPDAASQIAAMPEPQRHQVLSKLKLQNPSLYQAVAAVLSGQGQGSLPNGGTLPEQRSPRAGPARQQI